MKNPLIPERPKNVSFTYEGVGLGNVDSERIESVSFETHVDGSPLNTTTLRVALRVKNLRSPQSFDLLIGDDLTRAAQESIESPVRTFPDLPIDLCRQFLEDIPMLLDFIDGGGFIKGSPERYEGFDLFWMGWQPIQNGTRVLGKWLALTPDKSRRAYAATPGGEGFYELGDKFDIEPRPEQIAFPLFPGLLAGTHSPESESAMNACLERLIALIDKTIMAEKQAMRDQVERFRKTGEWNALDPEK